MSGTSLFYYRGGKGRENKKKGKGDRKREKCKNRTRMDKRMKQRTQEEKLSMDKTRDNYFCCTNMEDRAIGTDAC